MNIMQFKMFHILSSVYFIVFNVYVIIYTMFDDSWKNTNCINDFLYYSAFTGRALNSSVPYLPCGPNTH